MYLLDSNILIDFLRGKNKHALQMLRTSDAGIFKIPSIVKAELLLGVEKSSDPGNNRLKVELLLVPFGTLPFDDRCALHYARLRAYLEGKGMGIGANDYIIAACAMALGQLWLLTTRRSSSESLVSPSSNGPKCRSNRTSLIDN